jgi:hypothetical protein
LFPVASESAARRRENLFFRPAALLSLKNESRWVPSARRFLVFLPNAKIQHRTAAGRKCGTPPPHRGARVKDNANYPSPAGDAGGTAAAAALTGPARLTNALLDSLGREWM